jgi:hypothetical protein
LAEFHEDAEGYKSGRTAKRPGLQEARAQLTRPEVKAIVFETVSRLFRNLKELLTFKEECERCGVRLVSIREQFDTGTPGGLFVFHMLGAFAEMESNTISDRVSSTVEMMRHEKKMFWGLAPQGTIRTKEGKLAPSPYTYWWHPARHGWSAEQPAEAGWVERRYGTGVQRLFELRAEGHSLSKIGYRLNAEGFAYRAGKKPHTPEAWNLSRVKKTLECWRLYAGNLTYGRSDEQTPYGIIHANAWGPILPLDLIERVNQVNQERTNLMRPRRGGAAVHELGGLLYCVHCDQKLGVYKRRAHGPCYYHREACVVPGCSSIQVITVHEQARHVLSKFAALLASEFAKASALQETFLGQASSGGHTTELTRLSELRQQREAIVRHSVDAVLGGLIDKETLQRTVQTKLAEVDREIRMLETSLGNLSRPIAHLSEISQRLNSIDTVIERGDPVSLRPLYRFLFRKLTVDPLTETVGYELMVPIEGIQNGLK